MIRRLLPVILLAVAAVAQQTPAATPPPKPCDVPEQKQLNFWVGEWNATWPGPKQGEVQKGSNSIKRVLDGCIVEENFDGSEAIQLRGLFVAEETPNDFPRLPVIQDPTLTAIDKLNHMWALTKSCCTP